METSKTIIERATEEVAGTVINYEYEHAEGAAPIQITANVMRQNKKEDGSMTNTTVIRAGLVVETGNVQVNAVNLKLTDAPVLDAIVAGFASIVSSLNPVKA
jgi:hypothetical protein